MQKKNLLPVAVILLPTVNPSMIAPGVIPLLVFVNVRAGGGQGMQLKQSFRKLLNPHQVSEGGSGVESRNKLVKKII